MERMATEIIPWPNLYKRYVAGLENQTHDLLNTSRMAHLTDLAGPAILALLTLILQDVIERKSTQMK